MWCLDFFVPRHHKLLFTLHAFLWPTDLLEYFRMKYLKIIFFISDEKSNYFMLKIKSQKYITLIYTLKYSKGSILLLHHPCGVKLRIFSFFVTFCALACIYILHEFEDECSKWRINSEKHGMLNYGVLLFALGLCFMHRN